MTIDFVPPPLHEDPKKATISFSAPDHPCPWANELFLAKVENQAAGAYKHSVALGHNTQEFSNGAIEKIEMPIGWTSGKEINGIAGGVGKYKEFLPPNAAENSTRIEFYERGRELPPSAAANFKRTLQAEDHFLSGDEVKGLSALLEHQSDPRAFRIDSAQTETINKRRVLRVEGEYLTNNKRAVSLFIDQIGDGLYAQQVEYQAPARKFDALKPQVDETLKSIVWR